MSTISPQEALALEGTRIRTTIETESSISETITNTLTSQVFPTVMTGEALDEVSVVQNEIGEYQISFSLKGDNVKTFADFTSANIGNILAIVLDKQVISAPSINDAITDGRGVISGNFTLESANALAVQLRYGSLPIPLKVVEVRTIGPTLGQDSLQKSLQAGLIGFTIVVLFMLLYYRLPGAVADISIVIYALIAFALFRFLPVTLTLPGIAGFLLSTGSALDANILIFERMKEEMRSGRTVNQAMDLGWHRAWPSIRDSNIATLITCTILFWFGSTFGATIVKGFSLTLFLGVLISLFIAILVTRTLLGVVLHYWKPTNLAKWFGI
jgi:preprotein translocase subunit SecD